MAAFNAEEFINGLQNDSSGYDLTLPEGKLIANPSAGMTDEYFVGPDTRNGMHLLTDKFRRNDKLNEHDREIANWLLFDADSSVVFIKDPTTNLCVKVDQSPNGNVIDTWVNSTLKAKFPELFRLITSHVEYGESTAFSSKARTGKTRISPVILDRDFEIYNNYFPIFARHEADIIGPNGICQSEVVGKGTDKEKIKYCTGTISLAAKTKGGLHSIDYLEAFTNNIFLLKTKENTVNIKTMVKPYTNDSSSLSMHKFLEADFKSDEKDTFVTDWLKQRLNEDEIRVFKAWIWGVYVAKNRGRQVMWVYDPDGQSGKSVFFKACFAALRKQGLVFNCNETDNLAGKFDTSAYYDKRLIVMPDVKNSKIIRYGIAHTISGNDELRVEPKNKQAFSFESNLKILIGSNVRPEIDIHARHERSRLLIIKWSLSKALKEEMAIKDDNGNPVIDEVTGDYILAGDATMGERLEAHMKPFLAECEEEYNLLCINDDTIKPLSTLDTIYDISKDCEHVYDDFFDKSYEICDLESFITQKELTDAWITWAIAPGNDLICKDAGISTKSEDLIEHLTKRGVRKCRRRVNGRRVNCLCGICLRAVVPDNLNVHKPNPTEELDALVKEV